MTRDQLEHLLRAAGQIVDDNQFIIVGSQAILGKYPNAPITLTSSAEADMYAKNKPKLSNKLEAIGEASQFYETYGYYADPVSPKTATLPKDWKHRLINVKSENTAGVTGLCLDPHDLAISKIAAGREKDIEFVSHMVDHGMIERDTVLDLCKRVPSPEDDPGLAKRIAARLNQIFDSVQHGFSGQPANTKFGQYTGKILSLTNTDATQDIGRGVTVVHQLADLPQAITLGHIYTIKYKDDRVSQLLDKSETKQHGKTR